MIEREDLLRIKSQIDDDEIAIFNLTQVAKYLLAGVEAERYFVDEPTNTIVFVFRKENTKEVYIKWLDHTL
jgi:hypothetical protein